MGLKRILILGSIVLLLAAIPLTVYISQQQQQTKSNAQKSTTLCFSVSGSSAGVPIPTSLTPAPTNTPTPTGATVGSCTTTTSKVTGDVLNADIIMNPGSNIVSGIKLNITYDQTKFSVDSGALVPNAASVSPLIETTYAPGAITAQLGITINSSVGVDATKALSLPTKIASIQFKILPTATVGTASIAFGQTIVLSSNTAQDTQSENVLSSATPLSVVIAQGTNTTPTPTSGPVATNQIPVCTSLNIDRTASGSAPFSITFTGIGKDTDGTITKATFSFGDGPVQDVTQGGGIGTNAVSSQIAHTYNNAGTYQATTVFTDNSNGVSLAAATCTQSINVATGSATTKTATSSGNVITTGTVATATPTPAPSTPTPSIAATGPASTILSVGIIGAIVSAIGGILFFSF